MDDITKYELIQNYIDSMKENITNIYVLYNQLSNKERDRSLDYVKLNSLRNNALEIFDKSNKSMIALT